MNHKSIHKPITCQVNTKTLHPIPSSKQKLQQYSQSLFKKTLYNSLSFNKSIKQNTRKRNPLPFPTSRILCCMYLKTNLLPAWLRDTLFPHTPAHTSSHTQPTPHTPIQCLPANLLRMQLNTIQQQQQSTTTTTTKKPTTTTERTTTTTTTTTTTPRSILFNYDDEGRHKILHQEEVRKQDKYDHA